MNLPVVDLQATVAFYKALEFTFNPQFTDPTGACLILNKNSFVMLLTIDKFILFTKKPITDTKKSTGMLLALALPSKEDVDGLMFKVLAAGGTEPVPVNDYGFMYQRTFADLDGHRWEPFFFDTSKMPVS